MREEEAVVAITVVVAAVAGVIALYSMWQKQRKEERRERSELLRTALQHPQLDERTRAELLRAIAREQQIAPRLVGIVRTVWFAIGWLMFVGGGGALLLDAIGIVRTDDDVAAGFAIAGFAVLSLPLGLRELQRRDHAANERGTQRG